MRLYLQYIRMTIRCALQYRASLWLLMAGQFMVSFFVYFGIVLLFQRFGGLHDWTFGEVALCFGITHIAFAIAECLARGFDMFPRMVAKGDFDRLLVRPRSTALQVLGTGFELTRFGNFAQGAVVLAMAVARLDVAWSVEKAAIVVMMILGGAAVFAGLFILGATASFFTVEGLEFVNIFTNGGQEMSSYPLTIYSKWIRRFFTFVIPFGCMNYLPLLHLTGRERGHPLVPLLIPLAGFLFLIPCLWIWTLGVRKYTSTGS